MKLRKVFLCSFLLVILAMNGCVSDSVAEKDPEKEVETISLQETAGKGIVIDLSETEILNIKKELEDTEDIFEAVNVLKKNIEGKSATVTKVLEAVLVFKDIEGEISKELSLEGKKESIIDRVSKMPSRMIKRSETDVIDGTSIQNMVKDILLPKLDEAIVKLDEAIKLNEIIRFSTPNTGMNFTIEIHPSHLLFLESILKAYKGIIYYGLAYNLDITEEDMQNYFDFMENMGYNEKLGDAIMDQFSEKSFTVKDPEAKNQSYLNIKAATSEFIEAVENMPEGDRFEFDSENYTFRDDIDDYEKTEMNVMVIPKSFKDELVKNVTQIKNLLNGPETLTYDGFEIKLDLSVLFDNSVDIKEEVRNIMNHFSNSRFYENQDIAGLSDETLGGLLPEGLKNTINSLLEQINIEGPANWDDLVSASNLGLFIKSEEMIKDFSNERISLESSNGEKLYKVTGLTDESQFYSIQITNMENAYIYYEKLDENGMEFESDSKKIILLKNGDYLNIGGIEEEVIISINKVDVINIERIDINEGYTFAENLNNQYKILELNIVEKGDYKLVSDIDNYGRISGVIYNSNFEIMKSEYKDFGYRESDRFGLYTDDTGNYFYNLEIGKYLILVDYIHFYGEEGINFKVIKND